MPAHGCHVSVAVAAQTQEFTIICLSILISDAAASAQSLLVHMSSEVFDGMAANA